MRNLWVVCLLLGTMAWAQAKPAAPAKPPSNRPSVTDEDDDEDKGRAPASTSNVALDAAVLTIKGLCAKPGPKASAAPAGGTCQTVITRAQFEKLVDAVQPGMPVKTKRQLAGSYPRLLVRAREAETRGLNKEPRFEERLRFARLQILSQELLRDFQEESSKVSEKAITDYYHNDTPDFEQVSLGRVYVPLRKQMDAPKEKLSDDAAKAQQKEAEDAMSREAQDLHTRAAAGEDFAKLQKEAYEAAGIKSAVTSASLGKLRHNQLPSGHSSVFDLKPGEISQVISDASGHYIYKLESKEVESLDAVKDEIRNKLQNQRMQEILEKLDQSYTTDLNQAYFGTRSAEATSAAPSR